MNKMITNIILDIYNSNNENASTRIEKIHTSIDNLTRHIDSLSNKTLIKILMNDIINKLKFSRRYINFKDEKAIPIIDAFKGHLHFTEFDYEMFASKFY